jgi:hypothetical protein
MVQTRWTHLNRDYSMLTQIEAILLDGHFVLEHGARSRTGDFFNFNGTAGMWRIAGHHRRRRLAARHPHRRHRPELPLADGRLEVQIPAGRRVPAELPIEMTAFKTQQARWAKGLIQTSIKVLPMMFKSNVPRRIKIEAVYHLTANLSYPLMVSCRRC